LTMPLNYRKLHIMKNNRYDKKHNFLSSAANVAAMAIASVTLMSTAVAAQEDGTPQQSPSLSENILQESRAPQYSYVSEQMQWALDDFFENDPGKFRAILDPNNNNLYLVLPNGQINRIIRVATGRSRGDVLYDDETQGVTPAGTYPAGHQVSDEDGNIRQVGVWVSYRPYLNEDQYYRQMTVDFRLSVDGESLWAMHSTLGTQDAQNLTDTDPSNDYVTNGCVRMSIEDLRALIAFAIAAGRGEAAVIEFERAISEDRDRLAEAEANGVEVPLEYALQIASLIEFSALPQRDRSRENTLHHINNRDVQ